MSLLVAIYLLHIGNTLYTFSLGIEVTNSISREEFLTLLMNQKNHTEELKNLKDELDKKMEEMLNNYTQGKTSNSM